MRKFWNDERGFVITAEVIFILTILVIGLVVGWKALNQSLNNELEDLANAFSSVNQSYQYGGVTGCCASTAGSRFFDRPVVIDVDTCVGNFGEISTECEDSEGFSGASGGNPNGVPPFNDDGKPGLGPK